MNRRFLIVLIRYLSLLLITINSLSYSYKTSEVLILLLLTLIINNQIRFFNLKGKELLATISSVIEFCLFIYLSAFIDSFSIFYFIPLILDLSFLLSSKLKYIFLIIIIITSFIITLPTSLSKSIEVSSIFLIISMLCIYIYNEDISKINYQRLYDKLRISEDKLKRANSDLELYVDSVEELAILKERNRISREIHDNVGHSLSTTIIQLGAIEKLLENNQPLAELVHELREFVNKSFQDVRRAVSALKPTEYENYKSLFKIEELIKNFTKLTNINVKLTVSKNTWDLSNTQSMTLYRVIQESLSNSLRHGKASEIKIFITFNPDSLIVTISDNGIGCLNIKNGNGLNSISERISELHGSVKFNNSSDGFIIRASFPKTTGGEFIE